MSSSQSIAEPPVPSSLRDDRIVYGAVHLNVVELERSLGFWRDLIGLGELASAPGEARLGVDGRALVVLHPGAERPAGRGDAGLYHLAIHVPDALEFARTLVRIAEARVPQSPTDHIFSKATYLNDPDGIMLEITLETPERYRSMELGPHTAYIVDSEGRRRGATEPLDVALAVAPLGDGAAAGPLSGGSYIGHVHLHVPDLAASHAFYRDVVGFSEHAFMQGIGMADLSAGGRFPHRLAVNDWNGPHATQPRPGAARMRNFELTLRGEQAIDGLRARAAASGFDVGAAEDGALSLLDPAGNQILISRTPG